MRLYEFTTLHETFDNLFQADSKKKLAIADHVFAMLQDSYAKIGGIKGNGFNSPEDMLKIPFWKVARRGDEIKAVAMYKDKGGRKRVAVATDDSREGKSILADILKADALSGRAYAEISGPSLSFHAKILGDEALEDISLPIEQVQQIVGDEEIRPTEGNKYQRSLNGEWHEKLMIGTPGKTIN